MAAAMVEADALELTYEEAQSRSDWPEWKRTIQIELDAVKAAGTWELAKRPTNTNVVESEIWSFVPLDNVPVSYKHRYLNIFIEIGHFTLVGMRRWIKC